MRLLLDTHTLIWWDQGKLAAPLVKRIKGAESVHVSAVSAWEIAVKVALGKLVARVPLGDVIRDYGFDELPITVEHADAVRGLPPRHRDPFDRLLVVQAVTEGLALVTRDPAFAGYPVRTIWS